MYQKVIIIGNVGSDPEVRTTPNGSKVCNFSVAVNKKGYNGGEDETTWWRVAVWNKLADTCERFVFKGMRIYCEGEPALNTYTRQDGSTSASLQLTAFQTQFLSWKENNESSNDSNTGYDADGEYNGDDDDDDLPW